MKKSANVFFGAIIVTCVIGGSVFGILNYTDWFSQINDPNDDVPIEKIDPVFSSTPSNLTTFIKGEIESNLIWIAKDDNPTTYFIKNDSNIIFEGNWESQSPITFDIGNLDIGLYEYSIEIFDNESNVAIDNVTVEIIYNYGEALQKSIYFYMQQRSGDLPDDNPVIWRGDSGLNDGADVGIDLTGGYYDAGDHVKFALPMASTATTLAWSYYEFSESYNNLGQTDELLDSIKWGTDYLIKSHPTPNEFFFQVGDGNLDHSYWVPAEIIEEFYDRESFLGNLTQNASTPEAGASAALAFTALIYQDIDPVYADLCLNHSIELFNLANTTRDDSYYVSIAGSFYNSFSGFWDELAAASTLIYMNTLNITYLDNAEIFIANADINPNATHSWDNMGHMSNILLAQITENPSYIDAVETQLNSWLPNSNVTYTPGGLAWISKWGSLRYSANTALLASIWYSDPLCTSENASSYLEYVQSQIQYMLGSNPDERSFMIGFGDDYPLNPHHRSAHGSYSQNMNVPETTQHILFGALVGGPTVTDYYVDDRSNYYLNEVACDYNSGLTGTLAFLSGYYDSTVYTLDDFPTNYFTPEDERLPGYFIGAKLNEKSILTPRGEILLNGNFSDGFTSWVNQSSWAVPGDSDYSMDVVSEELFIDITNGGTENYHVQLTQPLSIQEGMFYNVSFLARADLQRNLSVSIGESGGSYTSYGSDTFVLTTSMVQYDFTFSMPYDTNDFARIEINMGLEDVSLYLDNFSIMETLGPVPVVGDILSNGDFSGNFDDDWESSLYWDYADFTQDTSSGVLFLNITDGGLDNWMTQFRQSGLPLVEGELYNITFSARSNASRSIQTTMDSNYYPVSLNTIMTQFSFEFIAAANNSNGQLEFDLGGVNNSEVWFDDISVYSYAPAIEPEGILYIEGDLITNGDFSDDLNGWSDSGWAVPVDSNFTMDTSSGELFVNITDGGTLDHFVQLLQESTPIRDGALYNVTFTARANTTRNIKIAIGESVDPWGSYITLEFEINTTMTTYNFSFVSNLTDTTARLQINMGAMDKSEVYLDNIQIYTNAIVGSFPKDNVSTILQIEVFNQNVWPANTDIAHLTYRYYFDASEVFAAGLSIGNVSFFSLSSAFVSNSGPIHHSGDIYYFELQYVNAIFEFMGEDDINYAVIRIGLPMNNETNDASAWDSSNDWSYQDIDSNMVRTPYIPVYDGNENLLYGEEPPL